MDLIWSDHNKKKTMLYVCYHAVKSKGQTRRHNFRCMTVSKGKLPPSCVVFTSSGEHLTKPNQTSNGCKLIGEVGRTKTSVLGSVSSLPPGQKCIHKTQQSVGF
jgi:hypothetical protein